MIINHSQSVRQRCRNRRVFYFKDFNIHFILKGHYWSFPIENSHLCLSRTMLHANMVSSFKFYQNKVIPRAEAACLNSQRIPNRIGCSSMVNLSQAFLFPKSALKLSVHIRHTLLHARMLGEKRLQRPGKSMPAHRHAVPKTCACSVGEKRREMSSTREIA